MLAVQPFRGLNILTISALLSFVPGSETKKGIDSMRDLLFRCSMLLLVITFTGSAILPLVLKTKAMTDYSPAQFKLPVRNETTERHAYRLEVDTYQVPELRPCSEPNRNWQAGHRRESYPIPRGWSIRMDPSELQLRPGEEQTITVDVDAPDGFRGRQCFNVNAIYENDRLAGGVTLYVESP